MTDAMRLHSLLTTEPRASGCGRVRCQSVIPGITATVAVSDLTSQLRQVENAFDAHGHMVFRISCRSDPVNSSSWFRLFSPSTPFHLAPDLPYRVLGDRAATALPTSTLSARRTRRALMPETYVLAMAANVWR